MLTPSQRARILHHLEHGWKLPDSLVRDLWTAYETLEQQQIAGREEAGRDDWPGEQARQPASAPARRIRT